jgi:hypothetical protein
MIIIIMYACTHDFSRVRITQLLFISQVQIQTFPVYLLVINTVHGSLYSIENSV